MDTKGILGLTGFKSEALEAFTELDILLTSRGRRPQPSLSTKSFSAAARNQKSDDSGVTHTAGSARILRTSWSARVQ